MAIEELEEQEGSEGNKEEKGVSETAQANESDEIKVLRSQVEELTKLVRGQKDLAPQNDQLSQMVDMLSSKLNGNTDQDADTGQFKFALVQTESEFDPEDAMPEEEWVTFFTHRVLYVIVDDKRNGRAMRAPIDKIKFDYESTKQVKNGKETDLINLSTYTCRSRKELKWLKEHSLYNIMFFDNANVAMSEEVERSTKMANHILRLRTIGQAQLAKMAREYPEIKVGTNMDLNTLRAQLASAITNREINNAKSSTERILIEQQMEADANNTVVAAGG